MPAPDPVHTTSGDGIADLQARRQRRAPLPPRHPRTGAAESASAPQRDEPAAEVEQRFVDSPPGEPAQPTPRKEGSPSLQRPAPGATAAQQVERPLRLGQFYVTPEHDEALRRIRATGLIDNMDVSGSAVVRYALDQLLAKHKPEELVRLLGSPKGQKQGQRGRPRR